MAVRYIIVGLLLGLLVLFFLGGHHHAQRRLRQGKQPLRYHRWMVRKSCPQSAFARSQYPYPSTQGYGMEDYPPPPPAYNHDEAPPPTYQPPEGGSKAMADQAYVRVQEQTQGAGGTSESTGIAAPAAVARQ